MSFWNLLTFHASVLTFIAVTLVLWCGISAVSAADESYVGYLGDTILLQGETYSGDHVYMFMTGPGLPANGVTLTDVTQRADQGQFTIVPLDNNQHFSFKWNTWLIHNEIDPGTYIVYVVNEPVDKAHLGSPSSYQILSVYLKKDPYISQGSVSIGTSYTLNPEMHTSTVSETPVPVTTTTIPTTIVTTIAPTQNPTIIPPTRAPVHHVTAIIAVICLIRAFPYWRDHS
jgi:hypothetical protein